MPFHALAGIVVSPVSDGKNLSRSDYIENRMHREG